MTVAQVIAIDGPSGVGKSTLARGLAEALGWQYLDTGGMYRCLTLAWLKDGAFDQLLCDQTWLNEQEVTVDGSRFFLNGDDVSRDIRNQIVTDKVSRVSSVQEVRDYLTAMQRTFAQSQPCVLDGRDIGTVVFPHALFKIFVTASPETRARRRWLELGGEQAPVPFDQVLQDQIERDHTDMNRSIAPLKPALDAWILDTDGLSVKQVLRRALRQAQVRLKALT